MKKETSERLPFSFDTLIEILLLIMVFLIPVIFDRRLGIVFSGTKIAWLRAFMVVTVSLWACKMIITRKHRFIRTPLDWPILSFLLAATVATLAGVHVYTSFAGFYGRFEGLSTWYVFGLLFFVTTNFANSSVRIRRIIAAVVSSATLMSIYGVIQRQELDPYMWGGVITWQRVIGTIGQPNFLAAYILMAFFLALVLFLDDKKGSNEIDWFQQIAPLGYFIFCQLAFIVMIYTLEAQDILIWYLGWAIITGAAIFFSYTYEKLHPLVLEILLGICLLLIYVCLLYTQSRGGYMGFFSAAVVFGLVAGRKRLFKNWKKISILGALIVMLSAFTMFRPEYSPFERFTGEIGIKKGADVVEETGSRLELKGAAGSRGETWKSAFGIIADNPLFGIGPEDLKMVFPRYETDLFRFKETFHVKQDRCHNETLDVPVTKGLLAFFIYLLIIFTFFRSGFVKAAGGGESDKLVLAGLLGAGCAYLVQNQFSFGVVAITSLFWVIWGMVMVQGEERRAEGSDLLLSFGDIPWLPVAAVVLLASFLTYFSFFSFRSDVYFKAGKTYLETRNLPLAVENLEKAIKVLPFEGNTISHLAIAYLNMGRTDDAIKTLRYGNEVDPFNADNFHMLARIYLTFYDRGAKDALALAAANCERALKIDPYYAEVYETEGMIMERLGQIDKAEERYERAFRVNPTLPGPIAKIAELSRRLNRLEAARKLFAEYSGRFPENLELFKALELLR